MGLLDYQPDPLAQGLLGLSAGLLTPVSRGGGWGAGLLGAQQGMDQARQQAMQMEQMRYDRARQAEADQMRKSQFERESQLFPLQLKGAQFDLTQKETAAARAARSDAQMQAAIQQLKTDPKFANDSGLQALLQIDPAKAIARAFPELKFEKFYDAQGRETAGFVAPGQAPIPVGGAKTEQAPWEYATPDGKIRPEVLAAKTAIAQAGKADAPRIDIKMGDSLAQQVGPILKASREATSGAVALAQSADRVLGALDKGGVFAGPGASWAQRGAQVADLLGVAGKDTQEKIVRTRQVIRGLAEASIEARKELAGQGQVTENEAKAVDKAISGDIDGLTVPEIREIANINKKRAQLKAQQHKGMLDRAPEQLRPFYAIDGLDTVAQPQEAPKQPRVVDFNSLRK